MDCGIVSMFPRRKPLCADDRCAQGQQIVVGLGGEFSEEIERRTDLFSS